MKLFEFRFKCLDALQRLIQSSLEYVFFSHSRWLWLDPKLKVGRVIILAVSVKMVNGFRWKEEPPKLFLHDETMLQNVASSL